jgi:hypothetical protein
MTAAQFTMYSEALRVLREGQAKTSGGRKPKRLSKEQRERFYAQHGKRAAPAISAGSGEEAPGES